MDTILPGKTFDISYWSAGGSAGSQNHCTGADDGGQGPDPDRQPAVPQYRAGHVSRGETGAPPISQFERIASTAAGISVRRVKLLGVLLTSASPASFGGRPVLRPIWATEALHRAYSMVRLVARLERRSPSHDEQSVRLDLEARLGAELAAIFDSLTIARDDELRACSASLRDVARNLVELFGPAIGEVTLVTSVDHLVLPAFRHRALILLVSELIINTLLHAFNGRRAGRVTLELARLSQSKARLAVTDDGNYPLGGVPHRPERCSVVNYLADLLQTELVCRSATGGGMIAVTDIPL